MTRLILIALLATTACANPLPTMFQGSGSWRGASNQKINGIHVASLYPGYWTGMPEAIVHDPGVNDVAATDLDPLQTTFAWMEDTVTNESYWLAEIAWLRTEWAIEDAKFSGTIDRTRYVDPVNGDNADDGTTESLAWATLLYAVNLIGTGDGTATKIILMPGVHYLEANSADAGTGDPSGGAATVKINNYAGTATDPLIIVWESGASVRIGHTWEAVNFTGIRDGDAELNIGIQVTGTTTYVEFWNPVGYGPMFEMVYRDGTNIGTTYGGGDASFIATISHTGDNIKVIGGEVAQWNHCGLKGNLRAYGTYIHNNGAASGGSSSSHDHGFYITDGSDDAGAVGCVFASNYGNGMNPRGYDLTNIVIEGNVFFGNGGFGINLGGLASVFQNNVSASNNLGLLLWGDDSAGVLFRNNAILDANIDTIGLGGAYTRPIGFLWTTNGKIAAASTSAVPTYTAWTATTAVPRPAATYYGSNNYFNRTTAATNTGSTAPTHTSGAVSDGVVTWTYVNAAGAESYGTFTTIVEGDFNNFAGRDFRPATGSALLSAGTDYGYGTTIGAIQAAP